MRMALSKWSAVLAVLSGITTLVAGPAALAQSDFPSKTIRVVVPFAPGGATDIVGRMLAERVSRQVGQTVVVENRAGANGNIGADLVAHSAPDGYTLLHNTSSIMFTAAFGAKVNYDLASELVPVSLLVTQPLIFNAYPGIGVNNIPELVAWAKANPGKLSYGSSGIGNVSHLVTYVLLQAAGIEGSHIPYKGGAAAFPDLIAGQIQILNDPINSSLPFIRDKRAKAIGSTGRTRSTLLPDVQTMNETVAPGFEAGAWQGAMVQGKTPPAIVARLNAEWVKALKDPSVQEKLAAQGAEVLATSPEQYLAYLRNEIDRWTKIIKASGARLE